MSQPIHVPSNEPTPTPAPPPTPAPAPPQHFADNFGDTSLRDHPGVRKFSTPEMLAKSYLEVEQSVGKKGLVLPTETSSPAEVRAAMTALGCPEAPTAYSTGDWAPPEGLPWDAELADGMREDAWQVGVNNTQWNQLVKGLAERQHVQHQKSMGEYQAQLSEFNSQLEQKYGAAKNQRVELARRTAETIFGADAAVIQFLDVGDGRPFGNSPQLMDALITLGEKMQEHDLLSGAPSTPIPTGDQAKAELSRLMADPAYVKALTDANDMGHKAAVERRDTLYRSSYPEQQGAAAPFVR